MKEGWEYKKLGEVCNVVMGQSPDGSNINELNGIEFHQGKTCFGERFLGKSELFTTYPSKLAKAHSVLICVRAPVGCPNITEREICIGRGLCSVEPKQNVDYIYLFYSLLGKQDYFEKNATGSTFKAISSKVVNNTKIQIPPLPIQQTIVSELDEINNLLSLKRKELETYDKLAQSLFYEMFGDPVENKKRWEVKKLGEVFVVGSGGTPSKSNPEYWIGGTIPWIGSNMCQNRIIYNTDGKFITEQGLSHSSAKMLDKGTVLVALVGATIGKVALLKTSTSTNQNVAFIKVSNSTLCNSMFVFYYLQSIYRDFFYIGNGDFKMANLSFVRNLKILRPPLPLQQLFATRIEAIEEQKKQVKAAIEKLETLLASRMQYWFE